MLQGELEQIQHSLGERVKELDCIYQISKLDAEHDMPFQELLEHIVNIIPLAWQYPEVACCCIDYERRQFKSPNFKETKWCQSADLVVGDKKIGFVKVCYLHKKSSEYKDPFLEEKQYLLDAIAERVMAISQYRTAKDKLWDSEEKLERLFDCVAEAIVITDLNGIIIQANESALRMYGFDSISQITGRSVFELITKRDRRRFMKTIWKTLKIRTSSSIEHAVLRSDGSEIHCETSVGIMENSSLEPIAFVNVMRDISERVNFEEQIRIYATEVMRAREEERKSVSRELHDETTQSLAALSFQIQEIIRANNQLPKGVLSKLVELNARTKTIMKRLHRICHRLRPDVLDRLGLIPAVNLMVEDLNEVNIVNIAINISGCERRLPSDVELAIFRILQEALWNIIKYSHATKSHVRLEFQDKKLSISITDNGVGFKVPEKLHSFVEAGKLGLVGIQERIRLLNGKLTINSAQDVGTMIRITLYE